MLVLVFGSAFYFVGLEISGSKHACREWPRSGQDDQDSREEPEPGRNYSSLGHDNQLVRDIRERTPL
jgi:hypothetical protein